MPPRTTAPPAPPRAPWATSAGVDDRSPWAVFTVAAVAHRMRWIPAGRFTMGSPKGESGRWHDEPLHAVELTHGYWLGETPVTQALWRAVMGTEPARFRGDERPVERVSWHDANAFCAALNARLPDLALSLPTDAEWEHACRAGTTTATWNGDLSDESSAPELDAIAWYFANSGGHTHDVRHTRPNPWGLHDMLGNVFEWCDDAWHETPLDGTDPRVRGDDGAQRVYRGGSWNASAWNVRAAARNAYDPDAREDDLGFRVAIGLVSRAPQHAPRR